MPDYSDITQEEFTEKLEEIVGRLSPAELMELPGFYEIASEAFNNEVLEELRPEEDESKVLDDDDDDDDECDG